MMLKKFAVVEKGMLQDTTLQNEENEKKLL